MCRATTGNPNAPVLNFTTLVDESYFLDDPVVSVELQRIADAANDAEGFRRAVCLVYEIDREIMDGIVQIWTQVYTRLEVLRIRRR